MDVTRQANLKTRIRARMADTGERYTQARRHVLADAGRSADDVGDYDLLVGRHPDTAALTSAMANQGILAEHSGEPLSEAMVLGVGGGLGAGYILWEFADGSKPVIVAFRRQWQYPDRWLRELDQRLQLGLSVEQTGATKRASEQLDAVLELGVPATAWVDVVTVGIWHEAEELAGYSGLPVVITGRRGDSYSVDDRLPRMVEVPAERLTAARARIPSYKNRLAWIDPARTAIDTGTLQAAVEAGLQAQVDHLSASSESFSLPAFRKWARLMTDTRNKKAWPKVFADPTGLGSALCSVREGVTDVGWSGGDLRDLYADFLDEAAALLDRPALTGAAEAYREAHRCWSAVGDAALPADDGPLGRLRELQDARARAVRSPKARHSEVAGVGTAYLAERKAFDQDCPLDVAARTEAFERLGAAVADAHAAETEALEALRRAVP